MVKKQAPPHPAAAPTPRQYQPRPTASLPLPAASGQAEHIPATGTEEIAHPRQGCQRGAEAARAQAELGFVMRVDQPQAAVGHDKARPGCTALKRLDGAARGLDGHQLGLGGPALAEGPQKGAVESRRQQMDKRQVRQHRAAGYLLVAAERHLPGREGHKGHAPGASSRPTASISLWRSATCSTTSWAIIRS